MKKITSIFLSLVLLIFLLPASQTSAKETYSDEMKDMINQGIITGYQDGTYRPYSKVKRGEFATFLYRALNLPDGEHVFKDVNRNSALAPGINAAAKAKIVTGTTATTFAPDSLITREQMATMINRALDYLKVNKKSGKLTFLDNDKIQAKASVMYMVGHKIILGSKVENGYVFNPKDAASREHAAAFISRMLVAAKEQGIIPPAKPETPSISAYEQRVIELTNVERKKYGLQPLSLDKELSKVARLKSQDMKNNNYFDHNSPTYGSPFDMMKKFGISYKTAGENIAKGQQSPEEVVKAWMESKGHRENILKSSYTHIGIGYVSDGKYWTQMFIGK